MTKLLYIFESIKNFNMQSFITLLIALSVILLFKLFSSSLSLLVIRLFNLKEKSKSKLKNNGFFKPLKSFFTLTGILFGLMFLSLPQSIMLFVNKIYRCIVIFLIAVGFSNCVNSKSSFISKLQKDLNLTNNTNITSLFSKIIKFVIYSLALVMIVSELGYDINGLIAGLGIGGVTIALAAQDTAKNLFGGFTILFDKPFTIGDWISTPTIEGNVEDITLRSTRIRTFKDSIVAIPNSTLSNESITNWSRMTRRRIDFNLVVKFDTPLKKLCDVVSEIDKMLHEHPNVCKEKIFVHFINIADSGMEIQVYFFTPLKNYKEYLEVKENINYRIMKILESNKVELAYPTQEIVLTK